MLRDNEFVAAFSGGTLDEASVDGDASGVLALEPVEGTIDPALVDGRAPTADDEVLLDPETLDDVGAAIGDEVDGRGRHAHGAAGGRGNGVLTDVEGAEPLLGNGAMLTFDGYRRLAPDARRNFFFARFEPGVDEREAVASLARFDPITGAEPVDVTNYGRVHAVPLVIGALLGVIAIATLLHTLSARSEGVDAISRSSRSWASSASRFRQVVAWQATTSSRSRP